MAEDQTLEQILAEVRAKAAKTAKTGEVVNSGSGNGGAFGLQAGSQALGSSTPSLSSSSTSSAASVSRTPIGRAQLEKDESTRDNLSSLDVYIRFGQENKSVEEITAEIKEQLAAEKPAPTPEKTSEMAQAIPETDKTPQASDAVKAGRTDETTRTPEVKEESETLQATEAPETPEAPKVKETPETTEKPEIIQTETTQPETVATKIAAQMPQKPTDKTTEQLANSRFARKTPVAVDNAPTQNYDSIPGGSISSAVAAAVAAKQTPLGNIPFQVAAGKELAEQADLQKTGKVPVRSGEMTASGRTGRDLETMRRYFEVDSTPAPMPANESDMNYDTREDAAACADRLSARRVRALVSLIALAVLTAGLLYLNLAAVMHWPLPGPMAFSASPYGFCVANLVLGVLAGVVASPLLVHGLGKFFTFAPGITAMPAISYLFALIQGVVACFDPGSTQKGIWLLMPVGVLTLLAAQTGELLELKRIQNGFRLVTGEVDKFALTRLAPGPVQQHLERLSSYDSAVAVHPVQAAHLAGYFGYAQENKSMGVFSRIAAPCLTAAGLLLGLTTAMTHGSTFEWVTAAAALVVVGTPMTIGLASPALLAKLGSSLLKKNAMTAGADAACALADTNGVITDAVDLFPTGTVTLHGVKTFDNYRIDEAILIVASVVYAAKSTYSEMFMDVIEHRTDILKKVDSYLYEDGMGLSAWISNRRVLVGNRQMLENHSVELPKLPNEEKYQAAGRELLYLAVAGEPVAMFILNYTPDSEISERLEQLHRAGFDLFVKTCDSNVNAAKLGEVYGLEPEIFKILPGSCYNALEAQEQPVETAPAKVAYSGRFSSFAGCMSGCARFKSGLRLIWILQLCSLVVCGGVVTFLSLTGSAFYQPLILLAVQLFWSILALLLPLTGEM